MGNMFLSVRDRVTNSLYIPFINRFFVSLLFYHELFVSLMLKLLKNYPLFYSYQSYRYLNTCYFLSEDKVS